MPYYIAYKLKIKRKNLTIRDIIQNIQSTKKKMLSQKYHLYLLLLNCESDLEEENNAERIYYHVFIRTRHRSKSKYNDIYCFYNVMTDISKNNALVVEK